MTRTDPDRSLHLAHADDLAARSGADLLAALLAQGVQTAPNLSRAELLAAFYAHLLSQGQHVLVTGALELLPEGFGFVRSPHLDYEASACDAFVTPSQVRALNLKAGHQVTGALRAPRGNERFFALSHIESVNGIDPARLVTRVAFAARTPMVATRPLALAGDDALRTLAFLAPWCRGQRVLVTAPPLWSRSPWLAQLAAALRTGDAGLRLYLCLLDQRPEDVAAVRAQLAPFAGCEVTGSTFGQVAERHVALTEMVLARAQRDVEAGHDVVLLVDSLTALVQASQRAQPASGRWLCAGLDAQAVWLAKRLFAAARACAEGGSLTVIATALGAAAGTVDAAVLAEFHHRGNSDVVIDAESAALAAAAPFDAMATRTRPEDDDREASTLAAVQQLRRDWLQAAAAERVRLLVAPRR